MVKKLAVEKCKVWIGDPCCIVRDGEWTAACAEMAKQDELGLSKTRVYEVHTEGWDFLAASTEHGDGSYTGAITSQKYPVDAGLLGIVILKDTMGFEDMQEAERLGGIFEVEAGSITLERYKGGGFDFFSNGDCIESIQTDIEYSGKDIIDDVFGGGDK